VIFYYVYETRQGPPDKNIFFTVLTIILALLMVSTLRFHGVKEIDFRERKPFWVLIVFVLILFVFLIHASTAIFIFAMAYLVWGIIENIVLYIRKMKTKPEAGHTGA